jgi:hypothetical protein
MIVGLMGVVVAMAYVGSILLSHDWDPSVMLAEGELAISQKEYAERALGREVLVREFLGHDGRFFFIQANDPWLIDPSNHAEFLDRPTYRSQRALYPMLAGGFGLFSPALIVWAMVGLNILAVGVGSALTAELAKSTSLPHWLGMAFCLNPGVLGELDIGGAGVIALGFGIAGLLSMERNSFGWAVTFFSGSVLARETMILFVIGAVFGHWLATRRILLRVVLIPALVALAWRAYITFRLLPIESPGESTEGLADNLSRFPFGGIVLASKSWIANSTTFVWTASLILLMLLFARRAFRSRSAIAWSAIPFLLLAVMLSELVWTEPYDIARAMVPIFTIYPLLLFEKVDRPTEHVFE